MTKFLLASMCIAYFNRIGTTDSIGACEQYGRECGRRQVYLRIPHAGYWFEYDRRST